MILYLILQHCQDKWLCSCWSFFMCMLVKQATERKLLLWHTSQLELIDYVHITELKSWPTEGFTKNLLCSFRWREKSVSCLCSSNKDTRTPTPVLTQTAVAWSGLLSAQSGTVWVGEWVGVCTCSCHPGEMTLSSHSGSFRQRGDTAGMQMALCKRTPHTHTHCWIKPECMPAPEFIGIWEAGILSQACSIYILQPILIWLLDSLLTESPAQKCVCRLLVLSLCIGVM